LRFVSASGSSPRPTRAVLFADGNGRVGVDGRDTREGVSGSSAAEEQPDEEGG